MARLGLRAVRYADRDASLLIAQVQREYVLRYGGPDASPVDEAEFASPLGLFLVGYQGERPVAMGGWRRHGADDPETAWAGAVAEIKRMYVAPQARGQGYARAVLAELEVTAQAAGLDWLLLETGHKQPEAIALYESSGYRRVPAFGHYACEPLSVHLGKQLLP
jgi:ribosomal protein S18 acetylase RimI-like enzyme